jgi:hypothetical protein
MNYKNYFKKQLIESLQIMNEENLPPVSWHEAIRAGQLGGEESREMLKGLYKRPRSHGEWADNLFDLHDTLRKEGVDVDHPHMMTIQSMANDAKEMHRIENEGESRSRAGK